jgi:hypothetical protein
LIIPDRSVKVSPIEAKTIGPAEIITLAKPIRMVLEFILDLPG